MNKKYLGEAQRVNRHIRESREAIGAAQFVLLLHSVPHLGEKALIRLLRINAQQRVTPEDFMALSSGEYEERYELDPRSAAYLGQRKEELLAASAELARSVRAHRLHLLTCESPAYPQRLERFDDVPPPILYALGALQLLDIGTSKSRSIDATSVNDAVNDIAAAKASRRFTFTIAVSNGASAEALARQDRIAAALVRAGGIPVTGHDRTPYKRLALSAQRLNLPIIYVLDRGLREALGPDLDRPPFAAARIRESVFDLERDLALSPFRLDDHGLGANNRRRDRMVFALADVVVAVDVNPGGGMVAECRRANEQGRPVFVTADGREGNAELLQAGCPLLAEESITEKSGEEQPGIEAILQRLQCIE